MSSLRPALSLLPKRGTTGIGSLPLTQRELALQMAFQVDVPYLPQLPVAGPGELMIPAALEGLPGLSFDDTGMCTVDLSAWREEQARFGAALDEALKHGTVEAYEPSGRACRAFQPFLWEVGHRKLALVKVQLAGPCTVRWVARCSDGAPISSVPELERQMWQLVLARALALVKAVRRMGATPIFFFDEPGLYALELENPEHLMALQELKLAGAALGQAGALVGVHCCGNTRWPSLLAMDWDLLSLDVGLSLEALVEDREAFHAFVTRGGRLSLGIVPTDLSPGDPVDVGERVAALVEVLGQALPSALPVGRFLDECLLTPACGLALRTTSDAEQTFADLKEAQRLLAERAP
jgi:hypothetical protein